MEIEIPHIIFALLNTSHGSSSSLLPKPKWIFPRGFWFTCFSYAQVGSLDFSIHVELALVGIRELDRRSTRAAPNNV